MKENGFWLFFGFFDFKRVEEVGITFSIMNKGKYVFAQLVSILPKYEFDKCVARHKGNYKAKGFTCWIQFLAMSPNSLTIFDL